MAEFTKVLQAAHNGYHSRDDYPPFSISPGADRARWNEYLQKINAELDEQEAGKGKPGAQQDHEGDEG